MVAKFVGKIALVAGGTGGLGQAVSLVFLGQDRTVTYRRQEAWDVRQSAAGVNKHHLEGHSLDVT
jgi:NAD(P)-dependent dehydrogenase (short-subunit alcohol dehydrogenase family)